MFMNGLRTFMKLTCFLHLSIPHGTSFNRFSVQSRAEPAFIHVWIKVGISGCAHTGIDMQCTVHGSVCDDTHMCCCDMQDVFEANFIPSDTDYRMFSAASGQLGRWPGLDIAHILDSATYHTRQDSLERLRPGILQAC